ncbi:MAG TPA: hypothetical protein VGC79_12025, partial [Polyangiaceae bacterium]
MGGLGLASLPGCTSKTCNDVFVWSLRIRVNDSVTGSAICDATVTATKGTTQTTLMQAGGPDCLYVGIGEELGTFRVSVSKAGYEPASTTVTVDEEDECHVVPKDATV